MPKYMLTRGQKRQPLVGHRELDRNGRKILEKVPFVFEPQKIVDTGDDVTMQHWVGDGVLVEVQDVKDVIPKKVAPPKKEKPKAEEKKPPKVEESSGSEEEETYDYEENPDGTFQCLLCDKNLKTEQAMIRHIESKH